MPSLPVRSNARMVQTFDPQAPKVLGPLLPSDRHDPGYDSIFEGGGSLRRDENMPNDQNRKSTLSWVMEELAKRIRAWAVESTL